MVTLAEIAWIAGFLEGEGTFDASWRRAVVFVTTDRDVAERAVSILRGRLNGPYNYRPDRKPFWRGTIHGRQAAEWCMTLYPLMGERRRTKIREWLDGWRKAPGTGRKEQTHCGRGHDLSTTRRYRTRAGHLRRTCLYCQRDYMRRYRAARKSSLTAR